MPGSNPLFGLNTLGGAISIQTKDGRSSPGGVLQTSFGSYRRSLSEFEYGGVSKDNSVDYFVAGTYFNEKGWRDQSKSDFGQLFGKIGWQGEKTDAKLSYAYANTDLNGNGMVPTSSLSRDRSGVYTWPDNTQNKSSFLNKRMRNFQLRIIYACIVVKKDIYINGSCLPFVAISLPSKCFFYF
jgi:outer membrane cobalamin receptor